ncbi:HAD family hydrolase [Haloferula sp. BvORR071]|uniref:HAD family hydrolase n=1 Tax=Haloferula sp. BvORR071 TaxID=1396141 RepID=UPI00069812BC|nr:HAD family hydrolase [Haloferula sp. BvORR071]
MTTALIFDLDNCLAPATAIGSDLYTPAFDAIRATNHGHLTDEALARACHDIWRHPLDWVAARHHFTPAMLAAAWQVFTTMEVTQPMQGYDDLPALRDLPAARFLVTTGFRRLQASKIAALGIAPLFTEIHIDAIDEPQHRLGKAGLMQQILTDHQLAPAEVLVIGDSAHSEIAAGNQLGIRTVQTLRPGVPHADNATFHIHSLSELPALMK